MINDDMNFDDDNLSMLILKDDLLGNLLIGTEANLEKEQYDKVIERLSDYVGKEKYQTSQVYFMVEYYMGQAIFRKEFAKKLRERNLKRKVRNFSEAIGYLENALELQPFFWDAKAMLGLVCMAMAGLIEREHYQQKAKILFEDCALNGNSVQKVFAKERLEFLTTINAKY